MSIFPPRFFSPVILLLSFTVPTPAAWAADESPEISDDSAGAITMATLAPPSGVLGVFPTEIAGTIYAGPYSGDIAIGGLRGGDLLSIAGGSWGGGSIMIVPEATITIMPVVTTAPTATLSVGDVTITNALALPVLTPATQAADESPEISEAYLGPITQAKLDAALNGLLELTSRLSLLPGNDYSVTSCVMTTTVLNPGVYGVTPAFTSSSAIEAGSDPELGAPGAPVTLDGTLLRALATFSTPREVSIGSNGGEIDTNGYDLTLSGNLTAQGYFIKEGGGALTLEGNNAWHDQQIYVLGGLLRGDTGSLLTAIQNDATVEVRQDEDGVYDRVLSGTGSFHKTGLATLTLSAANTMGGLWGGAPLFIDSGTLKVEGSGLLGLLPEVTIAQGSTLDLSAAAGDQTIGTLIGEGEVVLGGHQFVIHESRDTTYAGVIAGPGGLTKTGLGTLSLSGANTYAGGTVIADDAGTLALVDVGSLNPAAPLALHGGGFDTSAADGDREVGSLSGEECTITLGMNTLTMGRDNSDASFAGQISGSGGITKTGLGTQILDGWNTYSGVTTILDGTLAVQAHGLMSERIDNDATLILYDNAASAPIANYDGTIIGSGQVVKEGDGILWLRGKNSYHGGTTVHSGILIGNTDSLVGEITNHDLLAFYQVADGSFNGQIDGDGTLLLYGPGTLTLDGSNSYTGGTALSGTLQVADDANLGAAGGGLLLVGGTLRASDDLSITRPITLVDLHGALSTFDSNGHDLTLAGPIGGAGALVKEGDGTLTLIGMNTFTGATEVRSGRLAVEGALAGDLTIDAGAEAGGAGTIGGTLTNHGRLARGATIGAITVGGSVTFAPGSTLTVKADPNGNADHLDLTNSTATATLAGGTVDVQAGAGDYRYYTDYTILTAPGGINGEFAAATSNLAFLTPRLDYGPTTVELSLTRNDITYDSVATNEDQRAVARVLAGLEGSDGDMGTVMDRLHTLSAAEACRAFDSIVGGERTALPQVNLQHQRALAQVAIGRLSALTANGPSGSGQGTKVAGDQLRLAANDLVASDAPFLYALAGPPAEAGNDRHPEYLNGLWLQGYGGAGEIEADASAPDFSYTMGGVALGYDRTLGNSITLGLLGAYSHPRLEQDPNLTKTNSVQIGAYGSYQQGAVGADLIATFAQDRSESSRQVTIGGLSRHATADYNGNGNTITAEVRYTLPTDPLTLQPLVGLQWARQKQDAYSEEGAGALNLIVPDETIESLRSTIGLGAGHYLAKGEEGLAYEGRIGWVHELQDQDSIGASLSGDPIGTLFSLSGVDIPRDSAQVGLALAYTAKPTMRLYLDLDSEFNDTREEYTLTAGVGYRW